MSTSRRQARSLAVTGLYQMDLLGLQPEQVVDDIRQQANDKQDSLYQVSSQERAVVLDFFESLLRGTWQVRADLDILLEQHMRNWSLVRIGRIEKAILRLGSYELLHRDDIPIQVTLNEMVELSKSFCDERSKDFVNGVLDAVAPAKIPVSAEPIETAQDS